MLQLLAIPLGLLYGNALEWLIHRYILHGLGKNKKSLFSFHWHEHHKNARRHANYDRNYTRPPLGPGHQRKEIFALCGLGLLHAPLFAVSPLFVLIIFYCAVNYYFVHKRSHINVAWGRKNVPWHLDHHLAPNPDQNWCVTKPWFDAIMQTRVPYIGTDQEKMDNKRKGKSSEQREDDNQANPAKLPLEVTASP